EARVFENSLADQFRHLARRGRCWKPFTHKSLRTVEPALAIPAVQALEIVAADFGVDIADPDHVGEHAHLVLGCEVNGRFADGRGEAELLAFRKALRQPEASLPVNARARDGFIVRAVR